MGICVLAAAALVFVLLATVFPDNPVKAFFSGESLKEVDMSESPSPQVKTPTPEPSDEATSTPTETPDPNQPTPTPLVTEEEKATVTGWITASSGLVVRTGPSTQHAKLGTIPFGAKVEIIEQGAWLFIEYQGGGGYVHSNYVYIGDSPPGVETKNTNTSQTWTHLMNSTKLLVEKIFYEGAFYYCAHIETDAENILTRQSEESDTISGLLEGTKYALAVNGDDYGSAEGGVIIRNGKLVRSSPYDDIAVLYEDGTLDVYSGNQVSAAEFMENGAWQSWSAGPILVENFKAKDFSQSEAGPDLPNPRTSIGMVEPGKYVIITADGRQESSRGLTLAEFAALFEDLGCKTAYNLSGGEASVMFFENEMISSPSGGEERAVSDVIYVR